MSRKQRIEAIAIDVASEQRSLSRLIAQADQRLDDEREQQVRLISGVQAAARRAEDDVFMRDGILGPLADVATEHARAEFAPELLARGRRVQRDRSARFRDEIEALRAWANAPFAVRSGPTAVMLERQRIAQEGIKKTSEASCACTHVRAEHWRDGDGWHCIRCVCDCFSAKHMHVGAGNGGGNARVREPIGDASLRAVGHALQSIDADGARLLVQAYVEFKAPIRRVKHGEERDGSGLGYGGTQGESAMAIAFADRQSGQKDAHWATIIAVSLAPTGTLPDSEEIVAAARVIREQVKRARRAFRDLLRGIELDTPPKWIVPPPTRKEIDADVERDEAEIDACYSWMDGGVRVCAVAHVPARDAAARERCSACGRVRT